MAKVKISGEKFLIDGQYTYAGRQFQGKPVEGLLFNNRVVNAIFDDENPDTVQNWRYPDTGQWDPNRNVQEFISVLPIWRKMGLLAITVNLQGGMPIVGTESKQPWINTALRPDGSLKPEYLQRLEKVIAAADRLGMVVIVGIYYFGQAMYMRDEDAVRHGLRNSVTWLLGTGYENILLEVNNECDVPLYTHDILTPKRVSELISEAKSITLHGRRLLVSTSFRGGSIPTPDVCELADYLLVHGNEQTPEKITDMVKTIRSMDAYQRDPKPIVFNEDSTHVGNLDAALDVYASWGYYDQGSNDYEHGYQSPPVCWQINTQEKRSFFQRIAEITGSVI